MLISVFTRARHLSQHWSEFYPGPTIPYHLDPFQYQPPIYTWIIQVKSFFHVSISTMSNWSFPTNYKLQPTRCNVSWIYLFYGRCTCFRRFLCPSSGAHNCTCFRRFLRPDSSISSTVAAISSIGWQYLKLYVQLYAPDDGRRNSLKHVERL
jgi:hypothetical protein